RVFILAGEKSADQHGAELVRALRELEPGIEVQGYGGQSLSDAGALVKPDLVNNAVVGVGPIIPRIPFFVRTFFAAARWIREWQPDVVIPIDNPGFNMWLSWWVRRAGARVLYYVSPQVWAWWRGRIKGYKKNIDKMLCLFPFEEALYLEQGIRVEYVGHPLFDYIPKERPDPGYLASIGAKPGDPLVVLLPGSRDRSTGRLLPLFLEVAKRIQAARPAVRFVLPAARPHFVEPMRAAAKERGLEVAVTEGRAHEAMRHARAAIVTSGTSTLECMYFGLPMTIVYRLGLVEWLGLQVMLATKHLGYVNIFADREIVPEFVDWRDRPDEIAAAAIPLIDEGPRREQCLKDLAVERAKLGEAGASRRAAEAVLGMIRERRRRKREK
ncbi:MAG TPA: lipid-A-disaccharide synthase, partial [Planctomycetota bacterium]|nr:lipid-A-disaccharide synthase [Planctomycetota bacterium]